MIQETQLEAYESIQENIGPRRRRVLEVIEADPYSGATLFEICGKLGWPVNEVSGRVTELVTLGIVFDSKNRRRNPRTGRRGIVWVKANA